MEKSEMNHKIRETAKIYNFKIWEVADLLGVHETTLHRRLRHELPDEEQERICRMIREAAGKDLS